MSTLSGNSSDFVGPHTRPLVLHEVRCASDQLAYERAFVTEDDQNIDAAWQSVMNRCVDILPLFRDVDLRLSALRSARLLGLPSVAALRRNLVAYRLPPFELLRDWSYVVHLVMHCGGQCESIAPWALRQDRAPSVYYRFVRRVTGHTWSKLRQMECGRTKSLALQAWSPHLRELRHGSAE